MGLEGQVKDGLRSNQRMGAAALLHIWQQEASLKHTHFALERLLRHIYCGDLTTPPEISDPSRQLASLSSHF